MGIICLDVYTSKKGLNINKSYASFSTGYTCVKIYKTVAVECNENDEGSYPRKSYDESGVFSLKYYKNMEYIRYNVYGMLNFYKDEETRNMNNLNSQDYIFRRIKVELDLENPGGYTELYNELKNNREKYGLTNIQNS